MTLQCAADMGRQWGRWTFFSSLVCTDYLLLLCVLALAAYLVALIAH